MSRKKEQHEEHMDESWLIPYADLLTLLLALFIVLFASSQVDQQKFTVMKESFFSVFQGGAGVIETGGRGSGSGSASNGPAGTVASTGAAPAQVPENRINADPKVNNRILELQQAFSQYISGQQLQDKLQASISGQTIMITISDVVLFDSGSAEIKPAFYDTIWAIGNILAEYPDLDIQILGHTDNIPMKNFRYSSNWDLSSARAISFMKVMLMDRRLDPAHCAAIGYGEYRPVDTSDTAAGRARNRRVEVTAHFIG